MQLKFYKSYINAHLTYFKQNVIRENLLNPCHPCAKPPSELFPSYVRQHFPNISAFCILISDLLALRYLMLIFLKSKDARNK